MQKNPHYQYQKNANTKPHEPKTYHRIYTCSARILDEKKRKNKLEFNSILFQKI